MAVREVAYGDIKSLVGQSLGTSEWHDVTQPNIHTFAEVTGDHQWIHLDVERAKAESPYGTTIAHGYFTLSNIPMMMAEIWRTTGVKMGVNYGLNKVRFPSPVPVGKRIRAHASLESAKDVEGGMEMVAVVTIEVEGSEKPACVAQTVFRLYP